MSEPDSIPEPRSRDVLLAFVMGLWLALLQSAHFFLLEVRLSSRAGSFFIALFCWLAGFLGGLNFGSPRRLPWFVALAAVGYHAAYALLDWRPYQWSVLPGVAVCIAVGGLAAGAFFPALEPRFGRVRSLLFHENNGYVLGLFLALLGCVFAGRALLVGAPAVGALTVLLLLRRVQLDSPVPPAPPTAPGAGSGAGAHAGA